MKLRITHPGYHDQDGKPVDVGTIITITGNVIPTSLLNKAVVMDLDPEDKEPATGQKTAKRVGLEKQATAAEIVFSDETADDELAALIKAKKA